MYCDYRVMAEGAFKIGMNEVAVGIHPGPVLHGVPEAARRRAPAELLLATARMMTGGGGAAIRFVDELAPPGEVVDRAFAWSQQALQLPAAPTPPRALLARADLIELVRTGASRATRPPGAQPITGGIPRRRRFSHARAQAQEALARRVRYFASTRRVRLFLRPRAAPMHMPPRRPSCATVC